MESRKALTLTARQLAKFHLWSLVSSFISPHGFKSPISHIIYRLSMGKHSSHGRWLQGSIRSPLKKKTYREAFPQGCWAMLYAQPLAGRHSPHSQFHTTGEIAFNRRDPEHLDTCGSRVPGEEKVGVPAQASHMASAQARLLAPTIVAPGLFLRTSDNKGGMR